MLGFDLSGKVVVITGGAGELGSAMAEGFSRSGARTVILGHSLEKARAVAESITTQGGEALALEGDVLDSDSLEAAREKILSAYSRVDVLVNSAGGNRAEATTSPEMSFFDLPREAMQAVVDLNLMGTIYPAQVFGSVMAKQASGAVLNISSMTALTPLTNVAAYSAAKAGVTNFTCWLSVYMCQNYSKEIRVNALAPGFFVTNQNRYLLLDEAGKPTDRGKKIIDHTPMARYGAPEDLIGAAIFLCSDAARFITGVVLPVDGGFSAFSGV